MLRGVCATVATAPDSVRALRSAEESEPDLVVLDRMIPGVDGLEVARRLRERSTVPIIMLTALGEAEHRIEGLEAGLQGMRVGGVRRIVVPSALAYADRSQEPIPRTFAFQQRLYSTVLNDNRRSREAAALGADLVGKVMFDVKVLAIRPPR